MYTVYKMLHRHRLLTVVTKATLKLWIFHSQTKIGPRIAKIIISMESAIYSENMACLLSSVMLTHPC